MNFGVPADTLYSPKLASCSFLFLKKWLTRCKDALTLHKNVSDHISALQSLSEQISVLDEYRVFNAAGDLEKRLRIKQLKKMQSLLARLGELKDEWARFHSDAERQFHNRFTKNLSPETLQLMWSIDLIEDVVHAIERAVKTLERWLHDELKTKVVPSEDSVARLETSWVAAGNAIDASLGDIREISDMLNMYVED